jgi:predicted AAA+ superfamily ATPase
MERDLYARLRAWKASARRKPLLLRGARQTGKTYLLKELGRREYDSIAYFNFEADRALASFFERDLKPARILSELGIYAGRGLREGRDLIVFDEIQSSNRALESLKYFAEEAASVHLAAAGSLLGVKMSQPGSFPVGRVNFLDLHPMSFFEFLDGIGADRYRRLLEDRSGFEPLAEGFHAELIDLLRKYYFVGGMPEAVRLFSEDAGLARVREVHDEILTSYQLDFAKHAPATDIPKLTQVWESIPRHLARENKKFVFSALRKGARAREFENALRWLGDAGLVHLCRAVETARLPLRHHADPSCFKVYSLDVGLLGAMVRSPARLLVEGSRLFQEFQGAFVENYVAQELIAAGFSDLHYWRSGGGRAELDFLCEVDGEIIPLEVKAGINPRSKSLQSFDQQFGPRFLARSNLLGFEKSGKILNIPLYAIHRLPALAGREKS